MMFQPPDIRVIGPNRYCPDCGRILLEMHDEEEMYTVSRNTHCVMQGSLSINDLSEMPEEIEAVPEVFCLRRRCRFKRWRRGEKLPPALWDEDETLTVEHLRKQTRAMYVLSAAAAVLALAYLADIIVRILK